MSTNPGPLFTLQADFAGGGYATVGNLLGGTIDRGRQDELGAIEVGSCDLLADNDDGRWSPDNAASPYSPNVKPRKVKLRVQATYNAVTSTLWTGYLEGVTPLDRGQLHSDARLIGRDYIKTLAKKQLNGTFGPDAGAGTRIAAVLNAIGTPGLTRILDGDLDPFLATTLAGVSAWQHIQDVCAADRGIFFVRADGALAFHNRHHRTDNASGRVSQAAFGQSLDGSYGGSQYGTLQYGAAGQLPYTSLEYELTDQALYNEVRVTASGAGEATQVVVDATSQAAYDPNTLALDTALHQGGGTALSIANALLAIYKDPYARVRSITIDGDANPAALWPVLFAREIGDRITVAKLAPGAVSINRDFWIEHIHHEIRGDQGGMQTTYLLSDAASQGPPPYRLGIGLLDGTVKIGFGG